MRNAEREKKLELRIANGEMAAAVASPRRVRPSANTATRTGKLRTEDRSQKISDQRSEGERKAEDGRQKTEDRGQSPRRLRPLAKRSEGERRISSAVDLVRADIERGHPRTVDAEYDPQICFDHGAINCMSGFRRELMNFVGRKRRVKGIALELLPGAPNGFFLPRAEPIKIAPEFFDSPILIAHASGGVSFRAVSIETNRSF